MSACDEYRLQILHYLDNSLHGEELAVFRAHLEHCKNCRATVETERDLSQLLRQSRPLYSAPPALRARVMRTLASGWTDPARIARLRVLAASLVVAAMLLAFVPNVERQVRAASYVQTAVATHRSYVAAWLSSCTRTPPSR